MKTIQEISTALEAEYTRESYNLAPVKRLKDGNDYISWNDSADLMNKMFGPLGWSCTLISNTFREMDDGETVHRGYEAIVRVEVHYIDQAGEVQHVHRDGAGFGAVVPQGRKNPLDLAYKAAPSDAFSRAVKQLGDHFGLFLYDKVEEDTGGSYTSQRASGTTQRSGSTGASSGGGKSYPVSDGRIPHLKKNGYSDEQIAGINNAQASRFLDCLWKENMSAEEAAEEAGIPQPANTATAKAKDGLPLPAGRR